MARKIEGLIFKVQYDVNWSGVYIECRDKTDLFNYLADQQLKGYVFLTVNQICNNGTTPKVAVKTDTEFKRILKEKENPKEIRVIENYWTNDRGCHYSLTPTEEFKEILSQFWIDTTSLKKAREEGKKWISKTNYDLRVNIVIKQSNLSKK